MRWQGRGRSGNIEDRRGMGGGGIAAGGGIGAVVIGLIYFLLTGDPSGVQVPAGGAGDHQAQSGPVDPATDTLGLFVSTILRDTEVTWGELFRQAGETYQEPRLVLFSGYVQSACGGASTAVGPFYCPGDRKVYIDLAFYEQLRRQLNAPGDFAQAYVIAHEVGHHIQTLTGVSQQVNAASQRVSREEANQLSVMQELQADCYAGVWAHHAEARQPWLEPGDVEEALNAASAIGDDTLQRKSQGQVQPETFTHGTSAQRVRWFRRGFDTGNVDQCNTFDATSL
ncbi:MAG TPA: neutral zinc metallopeptidase [Longimicrobium sp.]|nr:neutral zinc metallopeptidase [Longimicrobium sp.]